MPKQLQLAIALRSAREPAAQSWTSATSHDSKQPSLKHFGIQLPRETHVDRLTKYNNQEGLSWSAHFLKYVVLESHLGPKMADSDLISALIAHFPTFIQTSCATVRRVYKCI